MWQGRNGNGSRCTLFGDLLFFQKPGSIKAIMLGIPDREGTGRVLCLKCNEAGKGAVLESGKVAEHWLWVVPSSEPLP